MKNMHECNEANDSHIECNKRMELMENQMNFLQKECNFKVKLLNSLLENLLNYENPQTKLYNNIILTPGNLIMISNSQNDKLAKEVVKVSPILN